MTQTQTDRIITNPDEGFVTCTKLQVKHKLLDLPKMQDVVGGGRMVVPLGPNPLVELLSEFLPPPVMVTINSTTTTINNAGPGGGGAAPIITAIAAVAVAAGTWKEEIKAGVDAAVDFVSDLID